MKKIILHLGILCIASVANAQTCIPEFEALKPIQLRFAGGPQSNYPIIPLHWNRFYTIDPLTGQLVSETCAYTGDPNLHEVALCACFVTGTHFRRVTDVCDPTPCGGDLPLPGMPVTNNSNSSSAWSASATWLANQVPDITSSAAVVLTKSTQIDVNLSFPADHWLVLSNGNSSILPGTTVTCNSVIQVYPSAQLENSGTINGSGQTFGNLVNRGTLSPGNSPGKFTIVGNYTATSSAVHQIEIASANEYDTIAVATDASIAGGVAVLNGVLNVSLLNGYLPVLGDTYKIFTFTSSTGAFSGTNLPVLPTGLIWDIDYNPTNVTLKVIAGFLPLKLITIKAYHNNNSIRVDWTTENEINTSQFDIEKSDNGIVFIKTGEVVAINSSRRNDYTFNDSHPLNGVSYYRLKQVDIDGRFTYSPVLRVAANGSELIFALSPNPASDVISIAYPGKKEIVTISIYDVQGRLMQQQTQRNELPVKVEVKELEPGMYFIQLTDGEISLKGKFVKQ